MDKQTDMAVLRLSTSWRAEHERLRDIDVNLATDYVVAISQWRNDNILKCTGVTFWKRESMWKQWIVWEYTNFNQHLSLVSHREILIFCGTGRTQKTISIPIWDMELLDWCDTEQKTRNAMIKALGGAMKGSFKGKPELNKTLRRLKRTDSNVIPSNDWGTLPIHKMSHRRVLVRQ